MAEPQIPFFKPDTKITITVGTQLIGELQLLYEYLLEGKTQKDAEELKLKIEQKQQLNSYEQAVVTVTNLVVGIQQKAKSLGAIEYRDAASITLGI